MWPLHSGFSHPGLQILTERDVSASFGPRDSERQGKGSSAWWPSGMVTVATHPQAGFVNHLHKVFLVSGRDLLSGGPGSLGYALNWGIVMNDAL